MHASLYVLLGKKEAENSVAARDAVESFLEDNGFCSSGGRFSSGGCADWFVIGGRWADALEIEKLKARYTEFAVQDYWKECEKQRLFHVAIDKKDADEKVAKAKKIAAKFFPGHKGMLPGMQDTYRKRGCEESAQLVCEDFLPLIKEGLEKGDDYSDGGCVIFMEESDWVDTTKPEELAKLVGNYWIVVVDFHN